jgi:two-component system chemotaxis response regulator CheB
VSKVRGVLNLKMSRVKDTVALLSRLQAAPAPRKEDELPKERGPIEIVAIASSTGGPPALQAILTALPADLSAGIVISQHMPAGFTRSFAERLNKLSALMVSEAAAGDRIRPGSVLIAPGGFHLIVNRDRKGFLPPTA